VEYNPSKDKNSIEDSVENEGNECPVINPSRMISMFNKLKEFLRETLKEELRKEVIGKSWKRFKRNLKKTCKNN
jgi:hypothetical protein